eukprot:scaffold5899_cov167-Amphora_coffeaeformis.AAC.2
MATYRAIVLREFHVVAISNAMVPYAAKWIFPIHARSEFKIPKPKSALFVLTALANVGLPWKTIFVEPFSREASETECV